MTGVVHVKDGTTWKCLNFSSQKIWVKDAGTWKEPTGVYVKDAGSWKKVYPSDLEQWTTSNLPTNSSQDSDSGHSPNLATANEYLNLRTADANVDWADGVGLDAQYVRGWSFGWSPTTSAGFAYGAVTRVEVTVQAEYINTPPAGETFDLSVGPQTATAKLTGTLTNVLTTYTFDYTVAGWSGLTNAEAGALHTSASSSNSIEAIPIYDDITAPSSTAYVTIEDLKCRVKYKYN